MYSYVHDLNAWIDPFGLNEVYNGTVNRGMLTDANGALPYILELQILPMV